MGRDIDKGSWINDEVYQRVNANDWTRSIDSIIDPNLS